jgi:hypothetical protein
LDLGSYYQIEIKMQQEFLEGKAEVNLKVKTEAEVEV